MKTTTAQKFGSLGKSFKSPSAAAAVIGAALLASGTTDTAETVWSPAAACLLPDVLPVAGTLLSYGGSRQLAAGGTVTHGGALSIGANALTCGRISTRQSGTGINIETNGLISGDSWPSNDYGFVRIQNSVNIGRGLYNRLNAGGYNNGIIVQGTGSTLTGIQFASASQHQGWPLSHLLYTVGSGFSLLGDDAVTPVALTCGAITASGGATITGGGVTSTAGWKIGSLAAGYAGLWESSITPSSSNYVLSSNTVNTFLNGSGSVYLMVNNATKAVIDSSGLSVTGDITASGAIRETPTQSALDPTTTNIPSGKRQGWYNSTLAEFRDWVNIGGTLLKSAAYT